MKQNRVGNASVRVALAIVVVWGGVVRAAEPVVTLSEPQSPPAWALLEVELLRANGAACREFYERYFDERGYLLCVERWGGDDGADDAIENCNDWPLLYALGGADEVRRLYHRAWEGHLRQYTAAKTKDVPLARDGMYYKEFCVMFDWLHLGEGITAFSQMGLGGPTDADFARRMRRYAGFYMNEDPGAPNYDPQQRIIRSFFNGSRGPLLRPATPLDWAGDPIDVEHRFKPKHGERSFQEMLDHFRDYTETLGDHPQNLRATSLATHAYFLANEPKYKQWVLEYVDAWRERTAANGGIIPSNIGRDGKIGGDARGKWYGGVYGWGFTVQVPQTGAMADRNRTMDGFDGFQNAFFLTGDDQYLETWRRMTDAINSQRRTIDGKLMYPRMYGDQGWYGWTPAPYSEGAHRIFAMTLSPRDLERAPRHPWLDYLQGRNAGYPEQALRRDLEQVRRRVAGMRADDTTPDTRLADDPLEFNPASVESLVELTLGGVHPGRGGAILLAALRYFDPVERRAGLPSRVAALVVELRPESVAVQLVNTDPLTERRVVVQGGAYGEHELVEVEFAGKRQAIGKSFVEVRLAPGAGGRLAFRTRRFHAPPTLTLPWER